MRCIAAALLAIVTVSVDNSMQLAAQGIERPNPRLGDKTLLQDTELLDEEAVVRRESNTRMDLQDKFSKLMTGARLTGQFTVDGKSLTDLQEETYEILKVQKQDEGDYWVITARIKYGKKDMTFPVPIEVKWAGTTPVLTLDELTIPGFGTFSARVVLHKNKYAGTWQHDDVGGHLFGLIETVPNGKPSATSQDSAP